jgi:hypothetical protein
MYTPTFGTRSPYLYRELASHDHRDGTTHRSLRSEDEQYASWLLGFGLMGGKGRLQPGRVIGLDEVPICLIRKPHPAGHKSGKRRNWDE